MSDADVAEILKLSAEHKLRLVELLWESLSATPYRRTEGQPVFQQARAPTGDELQGLFEKIVARCPGRSIAQFAARRFPA